MGFLFFVLSALAVAVPLNLRPVYFMVADDYLLNYIANGSYGTEHSDHLIYIQTPLGRILKMLYGVMPDVNWYMVLLAVMIAVSFAVVMYVIYKRSGSLMFAFIPLLPELFIVPFFFTYTVVAILTAVAAGAAMSMDLKEKERKWPWILLAAVLFGLSFNLRKDSFYVGTALACPVMLDAVLTGRMADEPAVLKNVFSVKTLTAAIRKACIPCLTFLLVVGISAVWNHIDYSSDEWREFTRYNEARTDVVDYIMPPYDYMEGILTELGLTKTDYDMLDGWKFCEKAVFSTETLEKLAVRTHEYVTNAMRLSYVKRVATKYNIMLVLIPLIVWLFLLIRSRDLHKLSDILILLIYAALLVMLTFVKMRFVHRVGMPMALGAVFSLLLCEARLNEEAKKELFSVPKCAAGAVLGILILIFGVSYVRDYRNTNYLSFRNLALPDASQIREELRSHPEKLYIMDAGILSNIYYYDLPVQQLKRTDDFKNIIRSGSWDSYSPRFYNQAGSYIDDPDHLLTALVREENVRFVTMDSRGVVKFLGEQYGRKVRREPEILFEQSGIGIVRFM